MSCVLWPDSGPGKDQWQTTVAERLAATCWKVHKHISAFDKILDCHTLMLVKGASSACAVLPPTDPSPTSPFPYLFHIVSVLCNFYLLQHVTTTLSMMFYNLISFARILATVHENLAGVTRCSSPLVTSGLQD